MTREELLNQIRKKKSVLCVGLDTDLDKVPTHLLKSDDPIFEFNRAVIEATADIAVAYKPNLAFYEAYGVKGWQSLEKTMRYLDENYPDIFTIADAKRGDIGNTSLRYAKSFFETLNFDSVTVAPYMGHDSVKPFLQFSNKWVILLALTSNAGASDFQKLETVEGDRLFEKVIRRSAEWGSTENLMYVVGATRAEAFTEIRRLIPNHFLLIPGVGAQGGDLVKVMESAIHNEPNILINSSRGIIYAGSGRDFKEAIRQAALALQKKMSRFI